MFVSFRSAIDNWPVSNETHHFSRLTLAGNEADFNPAYCGRSRPPLYMNSAPNPDLVLAIPPFEVGDPRTGGPGYSVDDPTAAFDRRAPCFVMFSQPDIHQAQEHVCGGANFA